MGCREKGISPGPDGGPGTRWQPCFVALGALSRRPSTMPWPTCWPTGTFRGGTHIGIDEISRKRGRVYVTNVYDLKRRRLLWSGEGRAKETLEAFFDWFGPERTEQLEGVYCDMWQPCADVVKARDPKAVLVFDKFHIVQQLTQAVAQVRRDEIREKGKDHKRLMAKTQYIWLKNSWNLTGWQQARLLEFKQLIPQEQPCVSAQGSLPLILGLRPRRLGQTLPRHPQDLRIPETPELHPESLPLHS